VNFDFPDFLNFTIKLYRSPEPGRAIVPLLRFPHPQKFIKILISSTHSIILYVLTLAGTLPCFWPGCSVVRTRLCDRQSRILSRKHNRTIYRPGDTGKSQYTFVLLQGGDVIILNSANVAMKFHVNNVHNK